MDTRIIAVDWSGAREPLRNLWLAEATPESIVEVRRFETRRAPDRPFDRTGGAGAAAW